MIIAFAMRKVKNAKGEPVKPLQSLEPLRNHWITGPELMECLKIGYTLKRVYTVIEWDKTEYIFKNYITKLFELKVRVTKNFVYILVSVMEERKSTSLQFI